MPKATRATEPGTTFKAGVGTKDGVNTGATPVCRLNWMPASALSANTARTGPAAELPMLKSIGAGCECLICMRIFSRSAVVLWVVKRLSAAMRVCGAPLTCWPSSSDLP